MEFITFDPKPPRVTLSLLSHSHGMNTAGVESYQNA
jgi:hypothetical protein